MMSLNNSKKNKEQLKKELTNLTYIELCEVFNIIRSSTDKYTENNNGVFINLKNVDDATVLKIWDFINFSKKNKVVLNEKNVEPITLNTKKKTNETKNTYLLEKSFVQTELNRIKNLRDDTFSFQNFLEKLSTTNLKQFNSTDKITYPTLKNNKTKFEGVKARLLRKCRDVNKNIWDNNINNIENNNEDAEDDNNNNEEDDNEDNVDDDNCENDENDDEIDENIIEDEGNNELLEDDESYLEDDDLTI